MNNRYILTTLIFFFNAYPADNQRDVELERLKLRITQLKNEFAIQKSIVFKLIPLAQFNYAPSMPTNKK